MITITDDSSEAEGLRARLIQMMTGDKKREDIIQLHKDIEAFFLSEPSQEDKMMVMKYSESLAILYDAVKKTDVMDSNKTFWFEQPYMPGSYNIAVQPFLGTDGRLHFSVPMGKYWALAGNLIKDEGEYFEFCCDDEAMGTRGGTYKFITVTLDKVKDSRWIP